MGINLVLYSMVSTMDELTQFLVGSLGGFCLLYGFLALVERRRQHRERRQQWERYASWRHRR
jgi:hypothetical protein